LSVPICRVVYLSEDTATEWWQLCVQELKLPAGRTASRSASCCVTASTPVRFITSSPHNLTWHVSR
jgi:hypothetical protein